MRPIVVPGTERARVRVESSGCNHPTPYMYCDGLFRDVVADDLSEGGLKGAEFECKRRSGTGGSERERGVGAATVSLCVGGADHEPMLGVFVFALCGPAASEALRVKTTSISIQAVPLLATPSGQVCQLDCWMNLWMSSAMLLVKLLL